ncbi:TrmB family transcriptional regulator [Candidatus Parcubacteria bacterium]|nr:MAG: TrmB family transcriptional regulator [Candidatus Parcubacteria bacterium]
MSYTEILQNIGLKKEEADIYLASLKLGPANISRLAKEVSVPRTSIYIHVKKLIEKGFMVKSKKGRGEYFSPIEPSIVSEQVKEKAEDFANTAAKLERMMDLSAKKPKVEFFDTADGIKKIYEKILKSDNKQVPHLIESGEAIKSAIDKTGIDYMIKFQRKILGKGIVTQGLITKDDVSVIKLLPESVKALLRQRPSTVRVIDNKLFPFSINLYLFQPDTVYIIAPQENFTLVLENKKIFESLDTMYGLLYEKGENFDIKTM